MAEGNNLIQKIVNDVRSFYKNRRDLLSYQKTRFYLVLTSFFLVANNMSDNCSYEEALYVANQLKTYMKLSIEQALYGLYKFVVKESSDSFFRHI